MLVITVIGGILLALLLDQPIFGRGIVRLLVISPFFVMPTVVGAGLEEPADASGVRDLRLARQVGRPAADRLVRRTCRCFSIILIVAWQWLPFATLILLTALQSLDQEQKEAAEMDGAPRALLLLLHHAAASRPRDHRGHPDRDDLPAQRLRRDLRHHQRRPGATNIAFLVYAKALLDFNVGGASAGGIVAVVLANIVAFFLVRIIGKNLEA